VRDRTGYSFVFAAPTAAANDIEAGLGVETFVKLWNELMGVITSKSTVLKRLRVSCRGCEIAAD
jgi:hypothetical protein